MLISILPHKDNILFKLRGKEAHEYFKSLFEEYYGSLISYGISMTGSHETARELVQDVFLKLWENKEKIRINESIKSYLFKAVFNRAANLKRNEKVKRAFEKDGFREVFSELSIQYDANPFLREAITRFFIYSLPVDVWGLTPTLT